MAGVELPEYLGRLMDTRVEGESVQPARISRRRRPQLVPAADGAGADPPPAQVRTAPSPCRESKSCQRE